MPTSSHAHVCQTLPRVLTAIEYQRCVLDVPGIQKITALLERADSCYLHEFLGLSKSLKIAADEAAKNMYALAILVESCAALSTSTVQVRRPLLRNVE